MERKHTTHIAILVVALLAVTVSIYSSDSHAIQDVSRKAYFIPILLAAFWYGLRGGVIVALTVCMLYIPHVILFWGDGLTHNPDRVSEIALYNIVGLITGLMMQKQMAIQEQYKRASEELEESYQQLKELTELRIQAEEHLRKVDRMATLGELAAHMAHEIGNPLGSIKGAAEILCDDYTEGSDKYEFVQILIQETQRLNAAIQDFLGFGKPRALELVESDLNQLIQTAVQFITPQCIQQAISVELLLDDTLDDILMDPRKMEQAILNILFNAIAAMPEGGTLTLSTGHEVPHFARIEIEDTGEGIPESLLDKIFEPFLTTRSDGTGLGLAIVRRIIEAHRGRISVESHEGKGTRFTILIPTQKSHEFMEASEDDQVGR